MKVVSGPLTCPEIEKDLQPLKGIGYYNMRLQNLPHLVIAEARFTEDGEFKGYNLPFKGYSDADYKAYTKRVAKRKNVQFFAVHEDDTDKVPEIKLRHSPIKCLPESFILDEEYPSYIDRYGRTVTRFCAMSMFQEKMIAERSIVISFDDCCPKDAEKYYNLYHTVEWGKDPKLELFGAHNLVGCRAGFRVDVNGETYSLEYKGPYTVEKGMEDALKKIRAFDPIKALNARVYFYQFEEKKRYYINFENNVATLEEE